MGPKMRAYPDCKEQPNRATRKRLRKEIFAENSDAYGRARRARKAARKVK